MICVNCRHQNRHHREGGICRCGCFEYETYDTRHERVNRQLQDMSEWFAAVNALLAAAERVPTLSDEVARVRRGTIRLEGAKWRIQ